MRRQITWRGAALGAVLLLSLVATAQGPATHDVRPGYGITHLGWLSDYFPPLRGTPGDTRIYILDSGVPGGTALVLGGTHGNEIAGILASIVLVERATPVQGRLIVIPHANNAVHGHPDPRCASCGPWVTLQGPEGAARSFRYSPRLTNPSLQSPDPEIYVHPSGLSFPGEEARNLNRVYPGLPGGTLTEQIAYAITRLVIKEKVDYVFDLHEAGVTSRLAHTLVCHPRALALGAIAVIDLELEGVTMKLEPSREEFRGLSHRELGDLTSALVFLIETPNPGQEPGLESPDVVADPHYPIEHRVGIHLELTMRILSIGNRMGLLPVVVTGVPTYREIIKTGVSAWLNW